MPARLHPRTGEPLHPIGFWRGQLVWPVMGASEPAPEPPAPEPAPEPTPEPTKPEDWTAAFGDMTPDEVKERLNNSRKWEDRAKSNFDKAKKYDDLEAQNQTALEKETKRAEEAEARESAATARALRSEIRSLADDFEDKRDAVLRLADSEGGLQRFLDDSGEIDSKAITRELKDILKDNPHLLKKSGADERDGKSGSGRPVEKLHAGAAPAARPREAAPNLTSAVQQHYNQQ